jgi:hypothetical protein
VTFFPKFCAEHILLAYTIKEKIHMKFHSDIKLTGEHIEGKDKHLLPKSGLFQLRKPGALFTSLIDLQAAGLQTALIY